MDVRAVIIEQLELNSTLRSFRMHPTRSERLIVAFADEYDEPRSGPFHFFDPRHERAYGRGLAACTEKKLGPTRFRREGNRYHFSTCFDGIPTESHRLSYYALSLPPYAVPNSVRFFDPRQPEREYSKSVTRDDQHKRFVLYLECRSKSGAFGFCLEVEFSTVDPEAFSEADYHDDKLALYGGYAGAYQYQLENEQEQRVQNFFDGPVVMGDQYVNRDQSSTFNNYAPVGALQVGANNVANVSQAANLTAVTNAVRVLREHIAEFPETDRDEVEQHVASIEEELSSAAPRASRLKTWLTSVQRIAAPLAGSGVKAVTEAAVSSAIKSLMGAP
ncbi:MAG: hypothetical protein JWM87_3754 [Candidatus Eremiobacteraeota bacterium]|nr:hypothetical protein [Candidatus Eremiobacteraeota bacterium]